MEPFLYLAHAVLGLILFATRAIAPALRARFTGVISLIGFGLAVAVFAAARSAGEWRTTSGHEPTLQIAAIGVGAAWFLLAALGYAAGPVRPQLGLIVGAASTALLLFATNDWVVPALLFWIATSAAAVAATPLVPGGFGMRLALAVADAAFTAGLIVHFLGTETWSLATATGDITFWLFAGAAAARLLAAVAAVESHAAPVVPPLVASTFVLPLARQDEFSALVGLALVACALAAAVSALIRRAPTFAHIAVWPLALMLGISFAEPDVAVKAALGGVAAAAALSLWPYSAGRGQNERGLLIAAVPATAGFGAVVGAAVAAFARAVEAQEVAESLPWTALAALLPLGFAAGVALGCRIARAREAEDYAPSAVLATWALLAFSLVLGLSPDARIGFDGDARPVVLVVVALAAGAAAARWGARNAAAYATALAPLEPVEVSIPAPRPRLARWLGVAASVIATATVFATGALTVEGLRRGFL